MKKDNKIIAGLTLAAVTAFTPFLALATTYSLEDVGGQVGLGNADLKQTIIKIISWSLGMLGLLAVTFIIYGGFTWLTAAGNEEHIEKAKKIIGSAVAGLIVVLLAWAIVIFVAGTTKNVTA